MKYNFKITLLLITFFLCAQIFGIYTFYNNISVNIDQDNTNKMKIESINTTFGQTTQLEEEEKGIYQPIAIIFGVLIATGFIFILIKLKLGIVFRYWFFFVIVWALIVALGFYLPSIIAIVLGIILALWRVFKPNIIVHNVTEVFIYTSVAIMFVGLLNIYSTIFLLILISIYDMVAVWKSKHMIKLAKFQTESKLFAGFSIPYKKGKTIIDYSKELKNNKSKNLKSRTFCGTAIMGGGDIAFPLLFSIVTMQHLIENFAVPKLISMYYSLIITFFVTIFLSILLFKAKKGKFYPAMPFISLGCFLGYLLIILIQY